MWRTAFLLLATANLILVSYSATHAEDAMEGKEASPATTSETSAPPTTEPSSDFHEAVDNAILDNKMEANKTPSVPTPTPPLQNPDATASKPASEPAQAKTLDASKSTPKKAAATKNASKPKKKKTGKKFHASKLKKKKSRKH